MECNKQEAVSAKVIAEKKLLEKDYEGAKRFALKAQRLFPEIENISQLLSVCEVHCAAAIKINGLDDWYGILQIEPTADESSIKKQYRKLALSLHPDKNKFAGAEAAFKLIGEAHRTLTDTEKRSGYDIRRKPVVRFVTKKQQSQQVNQTHSTVQAGVPNIFQNYAQFSAAQSILTRCPHCNVTVQIARAFFNRAIYCQNCRNNFVAFEAHGRQPPGTIPGHVPKHPGPGVSQHNWFQSQDAFRTANFTNTGFPAQDANKTTQEKYFWSNSSSTGAFSQGTFKATQQNEKATNFFTTGVNGSAACKGNDGESVKREEQGNSVPTDQPEVKIEENVKKRPPAAKSSKNQKVSRKPKIEECSEGEFSDSESSDSDVIIQEAKKNTPNMDSASNENRRRSTRQKRNVTYVEEHSDDDDFVSPRKKSRVDTPCHDYSDKFSDANEISKGGKTNKETVTNMRSAEPPKETSDPQQEDDIEEETEVSSSSMGDTSHAELEPSTLTYPDPEFHDFDHDRDPSMFSRGQIWATYDDLDGMPRFYAKIIDVIGSFKVRFTWLETSPETQAEEDWSDAGLPVACGNFRLGTTETTDNQALFSHLMLWKTGKKRNLYMVKPVKGEVWALYKNWNIDWSSDQEDHTMFEYDTVEIISDDVSAINIATLFKVQEFVSVFTRDLDAEFISIPPCEFLKFSHRIPSYKIPVPEGESLCRVYYELDPAALPSDSKEKFPSVKLGVQLEHALRQIQEKCFKPAAGHKNPAQQCTSGKAAESEWLQNFESEKSFAKLAVGQIWALCCDMDGFPRYYAYISNLDYAGPNVTVRWLDYCDDLEDVGPWLSNALPIACGKFKFSTSKCSQETLCTLEKFSHLVHCESGKRLQYNIYPRVGEVWALYKNWSIEWKESDMKSCEYDIVEVLNFGAVTKAVVLTKVDGTNHAIFMQKTEKGSLVTLEIPQADVLRFSHHVTSHRLNGGPWQGYWQLDPKCVPHSLLR